MRVELHAYDTSSKNVTVQPYENFKTTVRKDNGKWVDIDKFFDFEETPALENWEFEWANTIEAVVSEDVDPVNVAVTSRIWRKLKFDKPGTYDVSVQYGPKEGYTVRYTVIEVNYSFCYFNNLSVSVIYIYISNHLLKSI